MLRRRKAAWNPRKATLGGGESYQDALTGVMAPLERGLERLRVPADPAGPTDGVPRAAGDTDVVGSNLFRSSTGRLVRRPESEEPTERSVVVLYFNGKFAYLRRYNFFYSHSRRIRCLRSGLRRRTNKCRCTRLEFDLLRSPRRVGAVSRPTRSRAVASRGSRPPRPVGGPRPPRRTRTVRRRAAESRRRRPATRCLRVPRRCAPVGRRATRAG